MVILKSVPSTVSSGLWWLWTGVLQFFWYLVLAFSTGQSKCCISVANRFSWRKPHFNFLLYSYTEVYCLSFRSGSLCYPTWTWSFVTQREKCMSCSIYLCYWTVTSGSGEHVTTWASTAASPSGLWTEAFSYSVPSSACTDEKKQFHEQWDYSVLVQGFEFLRWLWDQASAVLPFQPCRQIPTFL